MRILIVNDIIAPYGGAELYTIELAKLLSLHGMRVDVLAAKGFIDEQTLSSRIRILTYDYHSILHTWRLGLRKLPSSLLEKFTKLFVKYDIVHFNNTILNLHVLQIKRKIPHEKCPLFVRTIHDYREVCPTLWRIKNNNQCPYQGPGLHCIACNPQLQYYMILQGSSSMIVKSLIGNIRSIWRSLQLLLNAEYYDVIIAPSRYLANLLRYNLKNPKIVHLYNFAPMDLVNSQIYNEGLCDSGKSLRQAYEGSPLFLFMARLSIEKGAHLIPLIARVLKKEHINAEIAIAGKGPLEKYISLYMRKLKLNNIKLLGYVNGYSKVKLLKHTYAVLLPSICCENHPMVIAESFILGKPILTFNIGGQGEIVSISGGGLSTPYLDLSIYVNNMIAIMIDEELYVKLSNNAYRFAKDNFNPRYYALKLINEVYGLENLWHLPIQV